MEPSGTPMRIISHALKLQFTLTPLFAAFKTASQVSHFSSIVNKQCWVFRFFLKQVNNVWHIWKNTYRTTVFIDPRSKQRCVRTYHHGWWKKKLNSNIFLLIWNNLYVVASEINFEIHTTTLWKETKYKSFWKKLLKNKWPLRRKTSKNRKQHQNRDSRNQIRVELNNFKIQNDLDITNLKETVNKGQRPYPFCHVKHQSDVLGGWVSKNKFIMTFCGTKSFQRSHFKRKNIINKHNLQRTHVCFPFHHGNYLRGTCTRRLF